MRSANALPSSVPVAAANTSENRFNQRRDRSSNTPSAVTAKGLKLVDNARAQLLIDKELMPAIEFAIVRV